MSSFSSDYCAVAHTATAPFTIYSFSLKQAAAPVSSESLRGITIPYSITADWSLSNAVSTYSDPLGSDADATEVSFYYTPSVTGSKAWIIAEPSVGKGSVGPMETFTSINSLSGQIVPTVTPMTIVSHTTSTITEQPSVRSQTVEPAGARPSSGAMDGHVRSCAVGLIGIAGVVLLL